MNSPRRIFAVPGAPALLVLVAVMAVSLIWLVDPYFESMWDAVLYVLTTRSLLAGEGYRVYGEPFHLRPPGFSLMLAPVLALAGNHYLILNLFTSVLGILALALVFVWFRGRLGTPVTFALCLSVWFNPQYQSICNQTLSDTAGLAALFGCFLLDRRARASPRARGDLALGFAIGAAAYLRTVCVLAIPAIWVSRLLQPRVVARAQGRLGMAARLVLIALIPFVLQVPWKLWKAHNPPPPQSAQHGIYSYATAQWQEDGADPGSPRVPLQEVLDRIPLRTEECLTSIGSRMPKVALHGILQPDVITAIRKANRRPGGYALGWLALACLCAVALWRRDSGSVFALGNLSVLLIYFDFDDRVVIPIYLFALGAFLEVLQLGLGRVLSGSRARWAAVALLSLMGVSDAFPPNDRSFVEARNRTNTAVARFIEQNYPPRVPVAASLGHRVAVYLKRPVWFLEVVTARQGLGGARSVLRKRKIWLVIHTGPEMGRMADLLDPFLEEWGTVVFQKDAVRVYELDPPWRKKHPHARRRSR